MKNEKQEGKEVKQEEDRNNELFEALSLLANTYKIPDITDEDRYGEIYRIKQVIESFINQAKQETIEKIEKWCKKEIGKSKKFNKNSRIRTMLVSKENMYQCFLLKLSELKEGK